ncbi:hypothetical protein CKO25_11140 [Thiocapsa imhoffii]|uniref:ISL3 family transposase n=1 Tax=Thiocapsa imhoffii TaxID=382777 RepID=A0A9X0WIN2_9GAMM|nr:hypothetical protein [Thiocapsa imhoffii]MBK1645190.1 hypothetical protein [Thiocapsa imhoffii]
MMTFDQDTIQDLLNLPDIAIDRVVLGERKMLRIDVRSTFGSEEGTQCHRCGKSIDHAYGLGNEFELRHLPLIEY